MVGTNGKGTVTNMIATGLSASGLQTGRFLSPHVEQFAERVSVDGEAVSAERIIAFVADARRLREETPDQDADLTPAFFEYTLALALSEFARAGAKAAVLEAGVGGGGDATRAVEPVRLTVITNVDLDHLDVLGPSLLDVARDKGGAIRPGGLVVSGVTQPEVERLLRGIADDVGADFHQVSVEDPPPLQTLPPTRLANARVATAGLRLLGVNETQILAGLRAAPLPGRGERFVVPTARGAVLVLLDGAHDPAASRRLRDELATEGRSGYVLLYGALARKQGQECLELLAPQAARVFLTDAAPPLWGGGRRFDWSGAEFEPDAAVAFEAALEAAAATTTTLPANAMPTLLISGSLYLAGRVRPVLRERGERQRAPWEGEGSA